MNFYTPNIEDFYIGMEVYKNGTLITLSEKDLLIELEGRGDDDWKIKYLDEKDLTEEGFTFKFKGVRNIESWYEMHPNGTTLGNKYYVFLLATFFDDGDNSIMICCSEQSISEDKLSSGSFKSFNVFVGNIKSKNHLTKLLKTVKLK